MKFSDIPQKRDPELIRKNRLRDQEAAEELSADLLEMLFKLQSGNPPTEKEIKSLLRKPAFHRAWIRLWGRYQTAEWQNAGIRVPSDSLRFGDKKSREERRARKQKK